MNLSNYFRIYISEIKSAENIDDVFNGNIKLKKYANGCKFLKIPEIIKSNEFITTYRDQIFMSIIDIEIKGLKI